MKPERVRPRLNGAPIDLETIARVPVDRLRLDRESPRLVGENAEATNETIVARLYRAADLQELLLSLSASGYHDIEPLIVMAAHDGDDGGLIVLEGNRRLAALRLLREPAMVQRIASAENLRISVPAADDALRSSFDLQMNPAQPGLKLHALDRAKDKHFWSVRVSRDLRLIVHRTASSFLLCYVDHHDAAYQWAERRRLDRHPTTGAAQLVEIRETVREIRVPRYVERDTRADRPAAAGPAPPSASAAAAGPAPAAAAAAGPIFGGASDDYLLGYGVPGEWLNDVRAATEDTLLDVADHLPAEAAEALLQIATGGAPAHPTPAPAGADPFAHPDAQRRFRVMGDVEALTRALDYPWEKWTVFLHPAQRQLVERQYNGPARAAGSAGTGKTIVALHRAVHLARTHPERRVLLATFSETLATALRTRLVRLIGNEPKLAERLEVHSMRNVGRRLFAARVGRLELAGDHDVRALLARAAEGVEGHRFTAHFLWTEWSEVVDAWQLGSWEEYRDVQRLGRKTRLAGKQRELLWSIFSRVRSELAVRERLTEPAMFACLTAQLAEAGAAPFDHCVIDEAQDVGVAELRFLAALGGGRPDGLFFAGDLGQRIFQTPFSWRALGVDVRGRSHTLRINYRTSHQIRRQADRLLPPELADVDGNAEQRGATVSVFNGPEPEVRTFDTPEAETAAVAKWLQARTAEGYAPQAIGVFVRSPDQVARAVAAVREGGLTPVELDARSVVASGAVAVGTMHLAKGLEFRAVAVVACDDEILPLQSRIERVADNADLEEVYSTERHLLYVACTRARDRLLVTGVEPASEFLDDLRGES